MKNLVKSRVSEGHEKGQDIGQDTKKDMKNRKEKVMNFYEDIKTIMQMKDLKSVAWKVTGENPAFECERVQVRFEDVEGSVYELVIHDERTMYKKYRNQEEVILNVAFCHFGIIPSGEWIGITTKIETMVNMCREKAKYDGTFFVNEERCIWNEFEVPVHVF